MHVGWRTLKSVVCLFYYLEIKYFFASPTWYLFERVNKMETRGVEAVEVDGVKKTHPLVVRGLEQFIQWCDRKQTVTPMKLMRVCCELRKKGKWERCDEVGEYLTWNFKSNYEFRAGDAVSGGEMRNAIYSSLSARLPHGSAHGSVFSVNQPVSLMISLVADEDAPTHAIRHHPCREYYRREFVDGVQHGSSCAIHTCENGQHARDFQRLNYEGGLPVGLQYKICSLPDAAGRVKVMTHVAGDEDATGVEHDFPRAFTRAWSIVPERVREDYDEYMSDLRGAERLFADSHPIKLDENLQAMKNVMWP